MEKNGDAVGCDLDLIFSLLNKLKETGVSVELIDTARKAGRFLVVSSLLC